MTHTIITARNWTLAVLILGLASLPAAAGPKKPHVDPALKRMVAKGLSQPVRVIIRAGDAKRAALEAKYAERENAAMKSLKVIGGLSATVEPGELAELLQDEGVKYLEFDAPIGGHFTAGPDDKDKVEDTRLDSGHGSVLPDDWPWTGSGVGVAVIDSGIAHHPDFGRRITAFYDFTGKTVKSRAPMDPYGHGTFVAGLIAGSGDRTRGEISGVAPDVRLIGLRVLDNEGQGLTSDVIEAVKFAIDHKAELGIDILNMSVGHPVSMSAWTDSLCAVVDMAVRNGLIVVTSAGNFGKNPDTGQIGFAGISSPGNTPAAITVGAVKTMATATTADDLVADFSSRGPTWIDMFAKPDIVAPGHRLIATATDDSHLYKRYPAYRFRSVSGRKMLQMSGTSGSAAVVSGVIATMIEANRALMPAGGGLTPNAVKLMLQYSALLLKDPERLADADPYYHPLVEGAGMLNAVGATQMASVFDRAQPENSMMQGAYSQVRAADAGNTETWDWGQRVIWGDTMLFGQRVIWGNAALTSLRVIWGDSVRWGSPFAPGATDGIADNDFVTDPANSQIGDGIIWADNLVWGKVEFGSNIQFGDSLAWKDNLHLYGENIVWGNRKGR